ncbi:peptidase S10, partial [Kibdelosporangium lantanae]
MADDQGPQEPTDDLVTSRHTLGDMAYTVTTGRVVLRREVVTDGTFDGHVASAEVFLTSYTLDGE